MNIWCICGLKDYIVFAEQDCITLHKVEAHGLDLEMYFLIKKESDGWASYLVQRGKEYKRYITHSFEMAQISVCYLFIKFYMFHPHKFQWTEIDELIRIGNLKKAINMLNEKIGIDENHEITLHEELSRYQVLLRKDSRVDELFSCQNVFEAFRAYRYYSLLLQCLNAICEKLIPEFSQLTNEREQLYAMAMR